MPATTTPEALASVLSTIFRTFPNDLVRPSWRKPVATMAGGRHACTMTVHTPAVTIAELRADDPAAADEWYKIHEAARSADIPDFPPLCRYRYEVSLRRPFPGNKQVRALAYLDSSPAGALEMELPQLDNLENAEVDVTVHPRYRRRGVGRALFEHATVLGQAEGRRRVMSMTVEQALAEGLTRSPGPNAFATAMGMKHALGDVRRRLAISDVDDAEMDRLLAEGWQRAEGYSAVMWGGETPEEFIGDIAGLDSQFVDEAPMGDLAWEAQNVDAERVRQMDATRIAYGSRGYNTGLRHDASGQVVAWSSLQVFSTVSWHAWQNITLVHPAHRGHRLGVISKVLNLRHLLAHEPEVRFIDTFNADVNRHMIVINEAMGFRVVDAWANWQREI